MQPICTSLHLRSSANNGEEFPIAIVGASYAGLTLATVLHLYSIPYSIFDSKSLPFPHVMGGFFNVPSYEVIAKELQLNVAKHAVDDGPTRKEVVDSLLQRVKPNLMSSQRIVRIKNMSGGLFYLHTNNSESSDTCFGPFRSVVGADGVLSKVRTSALRGTFLIGDARWVNEQWWDLGFQRINKGADVAMLDGLELGKNMIISRDIVQPHIQRKFCAFAIFCRRRIRQFATLLGAIIAILTARFGRELKDAIFISAATICSDKYAGYTTARPLCSHIHLQHCVYFSLLFSGLCNNLSLCLLSSPWWRKRNWH